jgi:hypothetical protein
MRVQITKLPLDKAAYGKQVQGSLSLKPGAFGGGDYKPMNDKNYKGVKQTIGAVPREEANLEAEGGETAFGPISGQAIPDHLKIVGKRHTEGGVPLNLPDDTFIFSDTASLKINEPSVLAMFNRVPKKGGYTPAELAKPYNINKYKAILLDPDSSKLERDTATIMIKNFIMKLGGLAIVQESMKGFPQGIPAMAKPYMEANGISEVDLMPELKEQAEALTQNAQEYAPEGQNPMGQEEMQQMNPDQAMQQEQQMMQQSQGAPSYPEQMPSGAPVASPDAMAQMQGGAPQEEMMPQPGMAYGGVPYAAYGMSMGGFYPEYAFGGDLPRAQDGISYNLVDASGNRIEPDPNYVPPSIPYLDPRVEAMKSLWEGQPGEFKNLSQEEMNAMNANEGYMGPAVIEQKKYGGLPQLKPGGDPPETVQGIKSRPVATFTPGADWKKGTSSGGHEAQWRRRAGEAVEYYGGSGGGRVDPTAIAGGLCNKIKKSGNIDEMLVRVFPLHLNGAKPTLSNGDPNPDWEAAKTKALATIYSTPEGEIYKKCINEVEESFQEAEHIEKKKEPCYCKDKDGNIINDENGKPKEAIVNDKGECLTDDPSCAGVTTETETLKCKCTDPVTGEVKEFPIEKEEECVCEGGASGQTVRGDDPHWSIPAKRNIMKNLMMQTNPASSNVVLPGRAQVQGAYEEYQTKVDTAQSAVNALQSAVMSGMAGSTAQKQSQMKDLLGKSLRASMDAVAGVQSRNVDRQRETNAQQAGIDNQNIRERTGVMNQGLAMQTANQNAKIAAQNKKTANVYQSMIDADREMAARQNMNVTTPQYASEYDYGFVYPTGREKPFTGVGGADRDARINAHMKNGMTYKEAVDTILKEDRLYKNTAKKGGYVYTDSWNTFII